MAAAPADASHIRHGVQRGCGSHRGSDYPLHLFIEGQFLHIRTPGTCPQEKPKAERGQTSGAVYGSVPPFHRPVYRRDAADGRLGRGRLRSTRHRRARLDSGSGAPAISMGGDDFTFAGVGPIGGGLSPFAAFPGSFHLDSVSYAFSSETSAPTPEPASVLLLTSGLAALAAYGHRRRLHA